MDPTHRGADVLLAAAFAHPGGRSGLPAPAAVPDEVFGVLDGLITGRPRTVLDLGAREGALALPLAGRADHVDALDISAAMVAEGRGRPGRRAILRAGVQAVAWR